MEKIIMYGKPVAEQIKNELKEKFAQKEYTLATFLVGEDPASLVYRDRLIRLAHSLGLKTRQVNLPATATQKEAEEALSILNADVTIQGILPFMPLPAHLHSRKLCSILDPAKDVDCLSPANAGELFLGCTELAPCTPQACLEILKYYDIKMAGKNVVILGRSNVVGKPLALLLLMENATITICHSKTKNLPDILRQADIIVAAIGKANFVTEDMVKEGVVLVDVGINAVAGKIVGDLTHGAHVKASAYTPVPGGVGVVSNVMVMKALVR
mgnify:FL=1